MEEPLTGGPPPARVDARDESPQRRTEERQASSSNIVRLNVGGTRYTVGLSTMLADDCSYFSALFSGR